MRNRCTFAGAAALGFALAVSLAACGTDSGGDSGADSGDEAAEEQGGFTPPDVPMASELGDNEGALSVLANGNAPERETALEAFYQRFHHDALVLDKWFSVQALSLRPDTPAAVQALAKHPDFTIANPNRMRSLVGAFAANQRAFHDLKGDGYRFLADMILAVDPLNPQSAARLVPALGRWRRFEPRRAARMSEELERILKTPGLSKDVTEQASKSLS